MASGKNGKVRRPFRAVEDTWSVTSAPHWAFRTYLAQTLGGVLRAAFSAAEASGATLGVAHIPQRLRDTIHWWPTADEADDSDLLIYEGEPSAGWRPLRQPFSRRSGLGQDLWMLWVGKEGAMVLVAQRPVLRHGIGLLPFDIWNLRLTSHPMYVQEAGAALASVWEPHYDLKALWITMNRALQGLDSKGPEAPQTILRSALMLADTLDPWTRRQLTDSTWIIMFNQIQEAVAWELRIERLMPAIADILLPTLGYDFFEMLIFSRVGKRYEEFLSYRKNMTGFGGKDMTLLLDQHLVEEVLTDQEPRLIATTREAGLLNPHLAQLSLLQEGLIIPLVHDRKAQGIMTLYYRQPTGLEKAELDRVAHVGQVISRSIENSNAHENMRRMATIDGLTSLFNKRSFSEQISREMRRFLRYGETLSLIVIDIDNFKHYNDTNGHLAGDRLLRQFSKVLALSVREQDIVARYGGEEFAVILPHTDMEGGYTVAEKIRNRVWSTRFPHGSSQPLGHLSISAGVADTTGGVKTHQELIDRADKALYHAKEQGRNRSMKYSSKLASQLK